MSANGDNNIQCDSNDSIVMHSKNEEKRPLIQATHFHTKPIEDEIMPINSSGDDGESEEESGESDLFTFATNSKKIRIAKMNTEPATLTTNTQTLMHLLKGNIGTGILAMPSAFANAGLLMGTLALPIMGIICIHCMHMLINCNQYLCTRLGLRHLDYDEVAHKAFSVGPKRLRRYAYVAGQSISAFLLITQFGFCCVYALFVSENLRQVISGLSKSKIDLDVHIYMIALLPLMIILNYVKSLKHLAIASAIANLLQSTGLVIVFYNLLQDLPNTWERPSFVDIARFPLYMGTAIYAFEGIGLVLPLQKEMREPESFGGSCGVLNTGMTVVACLYIAVGFFGYLKFGADVKGSITLNLPAEPLYETCRLMFAIAIYLSYAIQFYVPFNIIWPWFQQKYRLKSEAQRTNIIELVMRAVLVIATFCLAAAIPQLDLFISLVGALSSSCLALIFPPLIDIFTRWDNEKGFLRWWWIFTKDIFIFIIGILGFFTGTYASIKDIVKAFSR